tara:strand:+ start:169 stop:753 length:585 start_codon:yes stop_codon:yes gene_type:complete
METYKNLYHEIISIENLYLAYKKARKGKTNKRYVKNFTLNLPINLFNLNQELISQTYQPRPLETFIVRDPKTRKISKSDFRDRILHHALVNIIEPIFDKIFIHDSYANRKNKGTLKALKRFDYFKKKVRNGYCLKADIKHYFENIDHDILLKIIKRKIKDNKTIFLIEKILANQRERERETRNAFRKFNFSILC